MKIEVTQDDIDNAMPGSATECPIALAARRSFQRWMWVYSTALFADENFIAGLPPEAERFIRDFDEEFPVKPFVFEIIWASISK